MKEIYNPRLLTLKETQEEVNITYGISVSLETLRKWVDFGVIHPPVARESLGRGGGMHDLFPPQLPREVAVAWYLKRDGLKLNEIAEARESAHSASLNSEKEFQKRRHTGLYLLLQELLEKEINRHLLWLGFRVDGFNNDIEDIHRLGNNDLPLILAPRELFDEWIQKESEALKKLAGVYRLKTLIYLLAKEATDRGKRPGAYPETCVIDLEKIPVEVELVYEPHMKLDEYIIGRLRLLLTSPRALIPRHNHEEVVNVAGTRLLGQDSRVVRFEGKASIGSRGQQTWLIGDVQIPIITPIPHKRMTQMG